MEKSELIESWIRSFLSLLKGDRKVFTRYTEGYETSQLFITFINLPSAVYSNGAEAENNRITFEVTFPCQGNYYSKPVEPGMARVNTLVMTVKAKKLRGKTASQEVIAKYIADYLNRIVEEVSPNYTHTKIGDVKIGEKCKA